jgi:hypothetical protein
MSPNGAFRSIRFGVLCEGDEIEAWQLESLEALAAVPGCVPVVVVVNTTPRPREYAARRLVNAVRTGGLAWSLFDRIVVSRPSRATRRTALPRWLLDVHRMACVVTRKGRYSEYFDDKDIATLRDLDLDFLVKFGFGITRGEILTVARHGVWSFHHGDETRYRGAPPCFWEIYFQDPVTGSILQRLNERLDGGVVLKRGYFRTVGDSYTENRDSAFLGSAAWPAQVCRDILHGEAGYLSAAPSPSTAPVLRYPRNRQLAVFVWRLLANWCARQARDLLFCEMWNVGVVNEPVDVVARRGSPGRVRWLDPPAGARYVADPSGIRVGDDVWILAEDYDYRRGRGVVAAARLSAGSSTAVDWKIVLDTSRHLSYPQVFEHDGAIYCLPEAAESGEVTLYRAASLPDRWVPAATLLSGFRGVDSTLCFDQGRWWLFCTDMDRGDCSHLHVFYATHLTGPYTAHANNPVKVDIRGSRPAGSMFRLDGAWIRPAQNDAASYGASITLNRIVCLTPTAFREEPFGELKPDPDGPYPRGLHTLHGMGNITLVDGKCRRFVPRVLALRLLKKLRRMF